MPLAAIGIGLGTALAGGAAAGAGIYSAKKQASAAKSATAAQVQASNRAAEIEAQAAREALAFQKEQEATRKAEFEKAQALNFQQYQEQLARMAPYRNVGLAALGGLSRVPDASAGQRLAPGRMTLADMGGRMG